MRPYSIRYQSQSIIIDSTGGKSFYNSRPTAAIRTLGGIVCAMSWNYAKKMAYHTIAAGFSHPIPQFQANQLKTQAVKRKSTLDFACFY